MARIDVDDLRDYLLDYCGTAAFRVSRGACRRRPRLSVRADWSCAASHSGSASTQRSCASMPPKPASNMKGWAVSKSLFKQ